MEYKFEKLEVWELAMVFNSLCYSITEFLPESEKFNLISQFKRASTSIALNIAEGSTGQSNAEQIKFLSYAIRSYIEVIACLRLMEARDYLEDQKILVEKFESIGIKLFGKLQAFRTSLKNNPVTGLPSSVK